MTNDKNEKHWSKRIFLILSGSLFLLAAGYLPAFVQLTRDGFEPPVAIPFGVTMDDVQKETAAAMWIDARSQDAFHAGHIPGALNLNRDNWETALPHLFKLYSPGKVVIVYCSTGCRESEEIANRIRDLGLEPVDVLEGGFEAWQKGNSTK